MAPTTQDNHSVAITGLSCRFPGDGDNLENFWKFICDGTSAWSEIPKDRFNVDAFWSSTKNRNTMVTRGAHFVKQDVSLFDAGFFNISKSEAEAMDPQHRIMIEVVYEALEKAGLPLDELAGSQTGVFMGHFTSDYKEMTYRDPDMAPTYAATGASKTSLANRISWLFDLRGPSFTLDTACSSSLVALHCACQSLRTGESSVAIVGGSSLLLSPEMFMYLSNQNFLAPDGKCKSFDESANGYGRGEGFACLVLKRVDDAIVVGDPIRAVIRGSGSNQDGHTKGFTLPSADAQAALIEETYRLAGIDYKDTGYVEAHGTGTQAGDTQETEALYRTMGSKHSPDNKLIVGSVKSNIGHLEAAAGIAGIVKAVLILENGLIPPSINLNKLNPKIPFDEWNLHIPRELTPWPTDGVRRISTNSFGYGGTNAHAILEDTPHYLESRGIKAITNGETASDSGDARRLYILSAQDKPGLARVKEQLVQYIDTKTAMIGDDGDEAQELLKNLAFSLSEKRSRLQWKTFALASSLEELNDRLKDTENPMIVSQSSRVPRIGFVFTGQGAQWPRMGVELMAYKVFRESVIEADKYLREEVECPWSAVEELERGKTSSNLHLAAYSQTLCTVLQVALVDLLKTWGISPVAVAGHSSGEIGAAYCLGALSKEDAWKVAYYRGILSSEMKTNNPDIDGSMMAVGASPEDAQKYIDQATKGDVVVACINSPSSVTLSGDTPAIDEVLELIQKDGIFARKLFVDTAYHSPHMQIVGPDYYELLADIVTLPGREDCTMHSSVIGEAIAPSELGAVNWVKNLTSPVRFSEAIYDLMRPKKDGKHAEENAVDLLVEIGPHSALQGPATQSLKAKGIQNIPYLSAIKRNNNGIISALELAGSLSTMGVQVDLKTINNNGEPVTSAISHKLLVDLPSYPWKHGQKYWHETRIESEYRHREHPRLALIGAPTAPSADGERIWRGSISSNEEPWISDHQIQGLVLYPAAGFLAMAIEAASQSASKDAKKISAYRLRDIQLIAAAVIEEGVDLECVIQLRPHVIATRDSAYTWTEFVVNSSVDGKNLVKNCSGLLLLEYEQDQSVYAKSEKALEDEALRTKLVDLTDKCKTSLVKDDFYASLWKMGLQYGPTFANLTSINCAGEESACTVRLPDIETRYIPNQERPHIIHPATLDAIFHTAFAAVQDSKSIVLSSAMVPRSIDEIFISAEVPYAPGTSLNGFGKAAMHGFKDLTSDIYFFDEQDQVPVIQVKGFMCVEMSSGGGGNSGDGQAKALTSNLVWRPNVDLLSPAEQKVAVEAAKMTVLDDDVKQAIRTQDHSALSVISHIVEEITKEEVLPEYASFYELLDRKIKSVSFQNGISSNSPAETLLKTVKRALLGEGAAEELARDASVLNSSLWESEAVKSALGKLSEYVKLLHHTNPGLSILEIGTSAIVGPAIAGIEQVTKTGTYAVSSADEASQAKLEEFLSTQDKGLGAEVLDISKEIPADKAKDLSYDLVIAFNLSSNVADLATAVKNIKSIVKKGGKVALLEATKPGNFLTLLSRSPSSCRSDELQSALSEQGITLSFDVHDFEDAQFGQLDLSVYSAGEAEETSEQPEEITLIEDANQGDFARRTSDSIAAILTKAGYKTSRFTWGSDVAALKEKSCIVLVELEKSLLETLGESDFTFLKDFILGAKSILWVVGDDSKPSAKMIDGLVRVVRNETPGLLFRTFHAGVDSLPADQLSQLVARVWSSSSPDSEYEVKNGLINVSRIHEADGLNKEINQLVSGVSTEISKAPLGQTPYPVKLAIGNPGILDSLVLEPDDLPSTELEANKIEIDVKASGLNFREVMVAMGQIADAHLGFDSAGVVRRVGSAVTKFKVGDRVAMYGHGGHRSVHRSREDFCGLIPDHMSFEQAASIPGVHGTAWYGLIHLARIQKGQSILIHAAAGGVGQAAIQIAKHYEMEIFATVSSEVKRNLLKNEYGIPEDHIFNSRDLSFVQGVKRMTKGRGVEVVLNSLSGEALRQTWYCIAPFGTFLEIGIRDILRNMELDMRPFLQDATYSFFNINHIENGRPDLMAQIINGVFDLQRRGITRPITPLVVYPVSEVESAFRLMQTGKHLGKISISWSPQDVIPYIKREDYSISLDPNGVYLLAGGLGGLGRSMCKMLVDHGARKLSILSRSGGSSAAAQELIAELEKQNVKMAVIKCDIADSKSVEQAVSKLTSEFGPVRGVFQCAMVLRDTTFMNMTHKQWVESTTPKVQGSWNLHKNLPDVDFFITLSSFAGIFGNPGQANYAAAGAYEDALADYRRAHGQHALTLDLGIMRDVGVLAETGITESLREWEEPYGIRENEFHALIKRAIAGDITNTAPPQVITGLASGGSAVAAGISAPFYLEDARFAILEKTGMHNQSASASSGAVPIATLMAQSKSIAEAADHVLDSLVNRVAKILHTSTSEIDTDRFLHSYGIDSLVAIEIVNWALREIKSTITVFDVLAAVPISTTAGKIAAKSTLLSPELTAA